MVRHGLLDHVDDLDAAVANDCKARDANLSTNNDVHAPSSNTGLGGSTAHGNAKLVIMGDDDAAVDADAGALDMPDVMVVDDEGSDGEGSDLSVGNDDPDDRGDDSRYWMMMAHGHVGTMMPWGKSDRDDRI